MAVQPCAAYLLIIYLSYRKIGLCQFVIYFISVNVDIIESIILPYTLCLIIESVYRFVIVDPYIRYRLTVLIYRLSIEVVCRTEFFDIHILQLISMLCEFNVPLQIL